MLGFRFGDVLFLYMDKKYIRFETKAKIPAQAARWLSASESYLALKIVLKAPLLTLFGGSDIAHAVRYFVVVLFAAAVWPTTFRWFGSWGKNESRRESRTKKGGHKQKSCAALTNIIEFSCAGK
jgi:hypothetical protein